MLGLQLTTRLFHSSFIPTGIKLNGEWRFFQYKFVFSVNKSLIKLPCVIMIYVSKNIIVIILKLYNRACVNLLECLCEIYVFSVIFTARRYAGAVLAMALCLSVRPVCIEATGRIGLVWHGVFLPTLCYKEIRSSPQSKRTSSGALLQTLALENFATASRSCCQQLVDGRAC